jgi:hypothetical protein
MGSEGIDYATILADLENRRALLEAAIASLRAAMAGGAFGLGEGSSVQVGTPAGPSALQGGEVPDGAFFGKSIPAAMKLYLSIVAKKQTTKEIAAGLKKGGLETTSKYFEKIVHATLDRLRKNGEFVKIGDAWGLPEWYPAHIRAGLSQPAKQPNKKAPQPKLLTDGGPQAAVQRFFTSRQGREFSSKDAAQSLGLKLQTVSLIVGKLVHSGVLEKTENGMFRAR